MNDPAFQRRATLGHLVAKRRCILCHKVDGRGAILQPPLVQVAVRRLGRMEIFPAHLETLRQEDPHRYEAKKDLFDVIEEESDLLRKMSLWLHGYLKQPTFDNAQAKMPLQVLKPEEIDQLVSYVIQLAIDGVKEGVKPPE
ncbi:MAG: c-type cytochrome [Planctomycetota bacterium]